MGWGATKSLSHKIKICVVLLLTSLTSYSWNSLARSLSSLSLTGWNQWLALFIKKRATSLTSRTIERSLSSRATSFWSSPTNRFHSSVLWFWIYNSSENKINSKPKVAVTEELMCSDEVLVQKRYFCHWKGVLQLLPHNSSIVFRSNYAFWEEAWRTPTNGRTLM